MPLAPIDLRAISCSSEIECFSSKFTSIRCNEVKNIVNK